MINGSIYLISDLNNINYLNNTKLVFIGEPSPSLVQQYNGVVGSILLPPYQSLDHRLNNNIQAFNYEYFNYLSTKEPMSFIAAIVKALCNGINLLVYSNKDELDLYFQSFNIFMSSNFGINIGTPYNKFYYNQNFNSNILSLLYEFDFITYKEFMELYPANIVILDNIIQKMMIDNQVYGNVSEWRDHFYNIKESTKRNNNVLLNTAFVKVNK